MRLKISNKSHLQRIRDSFKKYYTQVYIKTITFKTSKIRDQNVSLNPSVLTHAISSNITLFFQNIKLATIFYPYDCRKIKFSQ